MVPETCRILGVPVDGVTEPDVIEAAMAAAREGGSYRIATVNAEYVMLAQHNSLFRAALESAQVRTPDGFGVVLAMRRHGVDVPARVGGSDLVWSLSDAAARGGHGVFLLGAAPGVADEAANRLRSRFPGLLISGTYPGGPEPCNDEIQTRLIRDSGATLLFVAFGSPAQELWLARLSERLSVPVMMGVGGSFDYIAGLQRRAPKWMQDRGLDWFWRLLRQPSRWRRMMVLPRFALLAVVEGR